MSPAITIHTKDGCPYCDMAKDYLEGHGITPEIVMHNDATEREKFYSDMGLLDRTMPQVLVDGVLVAGGALGLLRSDVASRHRAAGKTE